MHELSVVFEIVKSVEKFVQTNNLVKVDKLVLQIGQLSAMIPKYIEECYPAAVDGAILEDTKLEIEILPANGLCKDCKKVFNLIENNKICPHCGCDSWDLLGGENFL